MSSNEDTTASNGKGWTDRHRLAYYFNLVEHSNVKLDYANAPRPDGKTVGACRIMVDRLKGTLKMELAALRGIHESDVAGTPKKNPASRKRKAKGEGDADGEPGTPINHGRKKKEKLEEETIAVKPEFKEEVVEEEEF